MTRDPKVGVLWKMLFGTVTCLSFALPVISDWSETARPTCPDGYGLNYALPMSQKCEMKRLHDGSMVQSIPKLIPVPSVVAGCHRSKSEEGMLGGHRICRIPHCGSNLCQNSWCVETMVGYNCQCPSGFQGRHCDERTLITETMTEATTKSATSPTTTISEHSDTTTSQNTTTSMITESMREATTKPTTSPTTTILEHSDTTISQNTTTSMATEISTTVGMTKPTTHPTTTISNTTTSQEITTYTCSSPPVEYEYGVSFYNFSTCAMNHASAVSACSQYGSHLVFIESQGEQDFIVGVASEDLWIGLTGPSESDARWLDGSILSYSNFKSHSFNDNGKCFRIDIGRDCSWLDMECGVQYRFICEKEVGI